MTESMPVYRLLAEIPLFPPQEEAEPDGLLALGGDLSVRRLLEAYRHGIFPWYEAGQPILWWSPDPRLVLEPEDLKISRSLKKVLKKQKYTTTVDSVFPQVIRTCAELRLAEGKGTWITAEMQTAYLQLHELGYAHSFESWHAGELVGGLYGVSLGRCFFGESMFSTASDASKIALVALVEHMKKWDLRLIDCQMPTPYLRSMGAKEMQRKEFLQRLSQELQSPTLQGSWQQLQLQ